MTLMILLYPLLVCFVSLSVLTGASPRSFSEGNDDDVQRSNHQARGIDIDLNQPAIEVEEEANHHDRPVVLSQLSDMQASEANATAAIQEKRRIHQREYRKMIALDPSRKAESLAKQRAQQRLYRERLKITQTEQQKKARKYKAQARYLKRKQTVNHGFSSPIEKERHRIIELEQQGKANVEELGYIRKLRDNDRNRKRKQACKNHRNVASKLHGDYKS